MKQHTFLTFKKRISALPPVGQRMLRTAASVLLIFAVFLLAGAARTPFYAAIAAIQSVQPNTVQMKKIGMNRIIGTFIGAFFGSLVLCVLWVQPSLRATAPYYVLIALMIIPVIYTTVLLHETAASYFSCVVFLSVTIVTRNNASLFSYVFFRTLDTLFGVAVAMLCSWVHLPVHRRNNILFVSVLEDALLSVTDQLSPYSKVRLNQMIAEGAQFTIATQRTPASLIPVVQDIHLNMPIIAMNGAVLFDLKENRYCLEYVIGSDTAETLAAFFEAEGWHYHETVIIDDVLLIYYNDFRAEYQHNFYEKMRRSPYRNYIHGKAPAGSSAVYFLLVEPAAQIQEKITLLQAQPFTKRLRFHTETHTVPDGYCCLKLYSQNASQKNMTDYLKKQRGVKQVVTFGTVPGAYDVVIDAGNANQVVRTMERLYRPSVFKKETLSSTSRK